MLLAWWMGARYAIVAEIDNTEVYTCELKFRQ